MRNYNRTTNAPRDFRPRLLRNLFIVPVSCVNVAEVHRLRKKRRVFASSAFQGECVIIGSVFFLSSPRITAAYQCQGGSYVHVYVHVVGAHTRSNGRALKMQNDVWRSIRSILPISRGRFSFPFLLSIRVEDEEFVHMDRFISYEKFDRVPSIEIIRIDF